MRSRVGWDGHSHMCVLACESSLSRTPRWSVGLVQRLQVTMVNAFRSTGTSAYRAVDGRELRRIYKRLLTRYGRLLS